jgi:crotonobetainyl-CoA:carnitine CoA-transferase CaiB-like acyl-CoA transferase
LRELTTAAALRRLRAEGVPCAQPVPFDAAEAIADPSMRSRAVIVREQHYEADEVFEVGHTLRFGSAASINLRPAPATGQHSVEILRQLGKSDEEIEALLENRIVNAPNREPAAKAPAHARAQP